MISDINECEEGTYNCSSNAVCNNTKGSYNCTCKPGYEGDENNCTGDSFRTLVILNANESIAVFFFFLDALYSNSLLGSRPYCLKILSGQVNA